MSRFWAGASSDESSSDGDDDDSWASSGDGDDSDDGTGTDSDSDDDDDDDDKPARGRSKYAYDSDDDSDFSDEQRVVRSALEKRYRKVNDVVGELRDAMQSHNWNGVSAEFDRLHRVLNDTQLLPSALSGAPPPPAYVATLALLERLVERTLATRKAGGKRGGKGGGGGGGARLRVPDDIQRCVQRMLPSHRCRLPIFRSILKLGHAISRSHMDALADHRAVAREALNHPTVRALGADTVVWQRVVRLSELFNMNFVRRTAQLTADVDHEQRLLRETLRGSRLMRGVTGKEAEARANELVRRVMKVLKDVATAAKELQANKTGIGFEDDVKLGTNNHVFAILGPHFGHYYGDIVIIFKQDVLLHPDSFVTPCAGVLYLRPDTHEEARPHVPRIKSEAAGLELWQRSKMHPAAPDFDTILGGELTVRAAQLQNPPTADAALAYYIKEDSHFVFEGHLPQTVPLQYVHKILMPKRDYAQLTRDEREVIERCAGADGLVLFDGKDEKDVTLESLQAAFTHGFLLDDADGGGKKKKGGGGGGG
eukprot:CAMPEP_0198343284 /NCGR_PEP_ID=MMETSP1450-20131203/59012_1 /TAXON_ID=753684 ORGANISM="Madagascaria erythrocladiodes, Strain CCMP3234" /NCGR_SAMPLE_ID=MMETSP1450 /ASSEMBLY_ACC=CAM_ASM_001115 /LENGTH=538 /DNA_ID=CAMNT_0044048441 /DNA_START=21 /DNA_END=1634 /DNA_ORIENTATION=+